MSQSLGTDRIVCDSCGAQFRWKRELVGKRVKCACGHMIRVEMMHLPEPSFDDEYDLAPQAPMPVKPIRQTVQPKGLAYQSSPTQTAPGVDAYVFDRLKDIQIPVALIAAGTLVEFAKVFFRSPVRGYSQGFALIGIGLVLQTALLLTGAFAAAKLRGLSFGPFWIALLKLTAIAIAPGAAGALVQLALTPFGIIGSLVSAIATFVAFFTLYGVLFDLDESDTWFCVCINFILAVVSVLVVIPLVARMLV